MESTMRVLVAAVIILVTVFLVFMVVSSLTGQELNIIESFSKYFENLANVLGG